MHFGVPNPIIIMLAGTSKGRLSSGSKSQTAEVMRLMSARSAGKK